MFSSLFRSKSYFISNRYIIPSFINHYSILSCNNTSRKSLEYFQNIFDKQNYSDLDKAFNNNINHNNIGLFSVQGLIKPNDFNILADKHYNKCINLYNELINKYKQTNDSITYQYAKDILYLLDSISENICLIADASELCKQIHSNKDWLIESQNASEKLQQFISELNTDKNMLNITKDIINHTNIYNLLNHEEKNVLKSLYNQFKKHGLHTNEETRQKIIKCEYNINSKIYEAEQLIYHNNTNNNDIIISKFEDIVNERQELAKLFEYSSYSNYIMDDFYQFKNPNDAIKFLNEYGEQFFTNDYSGYNDSLTEKLFSGHYNNNQISEYFTLGGCMYGLEIILENLFNVTMKITQFNEYEKWHNDNIYRIELYEDNNKLLGIVYFDCFTRPGKFHGAASFCLSFRTEVNNKQIPKACALANISQPYHLSFSDISALFHEFGHILNIIFSDTQYQHLAGVRSSTDFVEMPSTLMELFLHDYSIVSQFAYHYKTKQVLPKELFTKTIKSRNTSQVLENQKLVLLSLFDLYVHSNKYSHLSWNEIEKMLLSLFPATKKYNSLQLYDFNHLLYYGSSYYCYLLCKNYSNTIYNYKFKDNPLNKENGLKYKQIILEKGGSNNPVEIMSKFLDGKSPLSY